MAGDWKISTDERARYEVYFQQCNPVQGYLSGEQARDFFVKSTLPGDILRKIWDLADVTSAGRLDKREFAIACHLISSQVQKKGPLPSVLPPSLISDSGAALNGIPPPTTTTVPLSINPSGQPTIVPLTPSIRSKYLQQFHSLVDVSKTNGFMTGVQAKTILQQTGLSNILLHQIWNLADNDKDGRLTPDEFVVAMHCCDIARTGQPLPLNLPDEWSQRDRINSASKSATIPTYANLNQQLKETINQTNTSETPSAELTEAEKKSALQTYEEKRLRNYEEGNRELERRRQALREQEERDQKEREERERKHELELQKQKDEQDRKKQMEIERQLEKQRQIEQQKEEERKKLYEQREAARKEMERKSRLEWERQRMQELSAQKSRLLEQINDLKSREKAFGLELENMNDTMETCQTKISQIEINIHTMDESIADIERNIMTDRNLVENIEQQKKDFTIQLNTIQGERESLNALVNELNQSKEFNNGNREADQIKYLQTQIENMTQENIQIDQEIITTTEQYKEYQDQIEQLRIQFDQLEQEAKDKKPPSEVTSPTNPPAEFANFDQFNTDLSSNDVSSSLPVVPTVTADATPSSPTVDVDPFQTVDPFASQSDVGSTTANTDWFQPPTDETTLAVVDPFVPKSEPAESLPAIASPRMKKAAPKANPNIKADAPKEAPVAVVAAADPWGGSTNGNNNGGDWAQFDKNNNTSSPFGTTADWPQTSTVSNGNLSTDIIQYRALYDYPAERPDELAISAGDIITIDPTKQQDEQWLYGQIGDDKQGFFPVAYTELITSTPVTPINNVIDTTSPLPSGSWVMTLAECQGKTVDKHLSFQKGELILVREQKDATWYSGQLHDKIGWFPRSYVRPATENEIENTKNTASDDVDTGIYEAVYSYEATDPSDLSFDIGQRIIILKRDGDWWTGQVDDRIGTFPYNYVQKIENTQEIAIATKSYQSTEEDYLSFEQDQIIYIINKDDDKGLYQGEIRLPDQPIRIGWFPADHVQIQTAALSTPPPPPLEQNISELPQYIAIFPYEAQQDDELSFPADAVLEILEEVNSSGWFKARLGDQVGLVPSTYVQQIDTLQQ